jgi:hypothetical protein
MRPALKERQRIASACPGYLTAVVECWDEPRSFRELLRKSRLAPFLSSFRKLPQVFGIAVQPSGKPNYPVSSCSLFYGQGNLEGLKTLAAAHERLLLALDDFAEMTRL